MKLKIVLLLLLATQCAKCFCQVDSLKEVIPNSDFGIFTGAWTPTGNASVLGTHPFIGLKIGAIKKKFEFGVLEEFRFLRSSNDYQVVYDNNLVITHQFFSALISGYLNYTLKQKLRYELLAIGGVGYDALNPITKDPPKYPHTLTIGRFNKNLGLGWRYHPGKRNLSPYVGIECVYNFVDYSNNNGTPLDGNTISIRLVYGSIKEVHFVF